MTLWQRIAEFNDRFFGDWRKADPVWWSNCLGGETGEVLNAVKHFFGGGTSKHTTTVEDIGAECVDVVAYLVTLCESLGISERAFNDMIERKLDENARKLSIGVEREPIED